MVDGDAGAGGAARRSACLPCSGIQGACRVVLAQERDCKRPFRRVGHGLGGVRVLSGMKGLCVNMPVAAARSRSAAPRARVPFASTSVALMGIVAGCPSFGAQRAGSCTMRWQYTKPAMCRVSAMCRASDNQWETCDERRLISGGLPLMRSVGVLQSVGCVWIQRTGTAGTRLPAAPWFDET